MNCEHAARPRREPINQSETKLPGQHLQPSSAARRRGIRRRMPPRRLSASTFRPKENLNRKLLESVHDPVRFHQTYENTSDTTRRCRCCRIILGDDRSSSPEEETRSGSSRGRPCASSGAGRSCPETRASTARTWTCSALLRCWEAACRPQFPQRRPALPLPWQGAPGSQGSASPSV